MRSFFPVVTKEQRVENVSAAFAARRAETLAAKLRSDFESSMTATPTCTSPASR